MLVNAIVAVTAALAIGIGLLVGMAARSSRSFLASLTAIAFTTGGWFTFIVTVTGHLRTVF